MRNIDHKQVFRQLRSRRPVAGLPKYVQLREQIRSAIEDGHWRAGEQLPTEDDLVHLTPFSLGTVQRALGELAKEGILIRRQGHGTYVADQGSTSYTPVHCRYVGDDGEFLPVYPSVVERRRERNAALAESAGFVTESELFRLDRVIDVGHEFKVYTSLLLPPQLTDAVRGLGAARLRKPELENLIHVEAGLRPVSVSHGLVPGTLPAPVAGKLGVGRETAGYMLQTQVYGSGNELLYTQRLFAPPVARELAFREPGNRPVTAT